MRPAKGQTMIEMIFAIAVIGIGLLAATTLVFSNLALAQRDQSEVQAVNLAREGLELAKNMRDSNWLAGNVFDTGLHSGNEYRATPVWNGTDAPSFDFTATDISSPKAAVMISNSLTNANFYENFNSGVTGATSTFSRIMYFHPICSDYTTVSSTSACEDSGLSKIGIRVESRVRWVQGAIKKDTIMYDDLYDWR